MMRPSAVGRTKWWTRAGTTRPGDGEVIDPRWQTDSWMPELVRYAAAKGVGIHVWLHYSLLIHPVEREKWLSTLAGWGVKGVKIDFMDSESQERMRWNHRRAGVHGPPPPHGELPRLDDPQGHPAHLAAGHVDGGCRRRGEAQQHRGAAASLPFTRNVIGSMDFTPGAFHRPYRPNVALMRASWA